MTEQKITFGKCASELQRELKVLLRDLLKEINSFKDEKEHIMVDVKHHAEIIKRGISTLESAVDFVASKETKAFDSKIKNLAPYYRATELRRYIETFIENIESLNKKLSDKSIQLLKSDEKQGLLDLKESILELQSVIYNLSIIKNIPV